MTKSLFITIAILCLVIVVLIFAMWLQRKILKSQVEKQKQKDIQIQNEQNKKTSEVLSNANEEKKNLHSDDNNAFNASLDILQKYANRKSNKTSSD